MISAIANIFTPLDNGSNGAHAFMNCWIGNLEPWKQLQVVCKQSSLWLLLSPQAGGNFDNITYQYHALWQLWSLSILLLYLNSKSQIQLSCCQANASDNDNLNWGPWCEVSSPIRMQARGVREEIIRFNWVNLSANWCQQHHCWLVEQCKVDQNFLHKFSHQIFILSQCI